MMAPRSRGGRWVIVPDGHAEAQARHFARRAKRRQTRILLLLVAVAVATGIWAIMSGGAAVPVHIAIDVATFAYGVVVVETRRRQAEQRRKLRSMARHPLSSSRAPWPEMERESVAL